MISVDSKTYDILKPVALVWLPLLGTIYFVLSGAFGLPDGEQVVGAITTIDTFLGGLLHLSSNNYTIPSGGNLVVDPEARKISLEPTIDPEKVLTLKNGDTITYTVVEASKG
jgi:putative holin Dp-1